MARNANRMQEATDRLSGRLASFAGTAITYARGGSSVALTATVGRTPFEVQEGMVWLEYDSRDFMIATASLILNGSVTLPASGDTITDPTGTYMVSVPSPLSLYESIGPDGTVLKIHTRKGGA